MQLTPENLKRAWRPLLGIGAISASLAVAFAWSMGWIGVGRVTSAQVLAGLEAGNPKPFPAGFRRAHGKGFCFVGTFDGSGAAVGLSEAAAFGRVSLPVVGRFSIGAGDPHAKDSTAKTLGIAMMITDASGNQWRMAMNHGPFLAVHEPEGVRAQALAFTPDSLTGAPDPAKVADFLKAYPEAAKFMEWMKTAPSPNSWATTEYNGMHAFKLIAADGTSQYVRWRMRPHARFVPLTAEQWDKTDQNVLSQDVARRIQQGPLKWNMVLTLANRGDPIDDPSAPWPATNRQIVAGTLTLTQVIPNAQGPCRDVNFDPTVLPPGIEISADPVLAARSGAYSHSFNRRERDIGFGRATDAVGQPELLGNAR